LTRREGGRDQSVSIVKCENRYKEEGVKDICLVCQSVHDHFTILAKTGVIETGWFMEIKVYKSLAVYKLEPNPLILLIS
jgi:hypothetical protein